VRGIRIRAHSKSLCAGSPVHQRLKVASHLWLDEIGLTENDFPFRPVKRDIVPLVDHDIANREPVRFPIDIDLVASDDTTLAHAPPNDRGMARHPAACC
jgi:hypothetical protein